MAVSWFTRQEYLETKPILPIEILQPPINISAIQNLGNRVNNQDVEPISPKSNAKFLKSIPDVRVPFQHDLVSFLTLIHRSSVSNTALCLAYFPWHVLER